MHPDRELLQEFRPLFEQMVMVLLKQQHEHGFISERSTLRGEEDQEEAFSLTTHFVTALVECGYATGDYLERALKWFLSTLSPAAAYQDLDRRGMNRLEALLLLNPPPDLLARYGLEPDLPRALLAQLDNHRRSFSSYDMAGVSPHFASLWALKLMLQAHENGLLDDPAHLQCMKDDIDRLLRAVTSGTLYLRHHEQALALGLRFRLFSNSLQKPHRDLLHDLARFAEESDGLWNARPSMINRLPDLKRFGLRADSIRGNERRWRDALLGTCYTIENLSPLRGDFPEIGPALDRAMRMFNTLLHPGPSVLQKSLGAYYNWFSIMSRLLIASQAYSGGYLSNQLLSTLIDKVSANGYGDDVTLDHEGFVNALRHWFDLSFEEQLTPLSRGRSGAQVVRIQPRVFIPASNPADSHVPIYLPGFESVIIKYGPHEEIGLEYENYRDRLPSRVQHMFARMRLTYQRANTSYLIIQDLNEYKTLEEYLPDARRDGKAESLGGDLIAFLQQFHQLPTRSLDTSRKELARELYFKPIWRYVDTVYALFNEFRVQDYLREEDMAALGSARELEQGLRELMTYLYQHERILDQFPVTYMHGDLHTRNIMVHPPVANGDLRFRFIDLEKFMVEGDYACDVGQLSVNLILLATDGRDRSIGQLVTAIERELKRTYEQIAEQIGDRYYPIRLALSECRARLRIAHGSSKDGLMRLKQKQIDKAAEIVLQALVLAELARRDLEYVKRLLEQVVDGE
ncbi:MAG: aminoglycoside phosphotransferase family protein [Anaerolineae bacterium]|nr:aminoglycoside phosphotransferase family protein [Anaerolineae bacterium]